MKITNAAFYYISEGYQTSGKSIMGRQSAGEGFLKGFAKYAKVNRFYCYGPDVKQLQQFQRSIAEATSKERLCSFIPFEDFPRLHEVGCLFVPGPNISNDVWVRRS
jgi:starch synthase